MAMARIFFRTSRIIRVTKNAFDDAVTPAPAISSLNYSQGDTLGGGQSIVITGTDLTDATGVSFGGTAATITANDATTVTCTLPAKSAGATTVAVTTAGGTSNTLPFTYWSPDSASSATVTNRWRADQGVTLVGSEVDLWEDMIGTMDQSPPGASFRLTHEAAKASYGNQPVLSSDGTKYMLGVPNGTDSLSVPISVLFIGFSSALTKCYFSSNQAAPYNLLWHKNDGAVEFYNGLATVTPAGLASAPGALLLTDEGGAAADASKIFVDDLATEAVAAVTRWEAATDIDIGLGAAGVGAILGEVAECVVWSGVLNATDRSKLDAYINQRYGL